MHFFYFFLQKAPAPKVRRITMLAHQKIYTMYLYLVSVLWCAIGKKEFKRNNALSLNDQYGNAYHTRISAQWVMNKKNLAET